MESSYFFEVLREDFSSFELGYLPSDISAIGEYHYYNPGYTGIWYEPNKCTQWQGRKCWMIKEADGLNFIEQELNGPSMAPGYDTMPMLVAGDKSWRDVAVESKVRAIAPSDKCGVVFRYTDSRHYYLFALSGGVWAALYKKDGEELIELATHIYYYGIDDAPTLKAVAYGSRISCSIDGVTVIEADDDSYRVGCVGIAAYCPARFNYVTASIPRADRLGYADRGGQAERAARAGRDATAAGLHSQTARRVRAAAASAPEYANPAMRLWRTLNLRDFGSTRAYRCADIDGDGEKELIFIQSLPLLCSGDEQMISCMTAVDLDGKVIWQIGRPARNAHMATCDLPVQVYDVDGDGRAELVYCKDFRIVVADAATGKTKYDAPTPKSIPHDSYKIYQNITLERIIGDSVRICNFTGAARPSDIMLKDRYNNIWAYNSKLELLWHSYVNCGHFPYAFDFNGDGRDELVAGHTLLSADGEPIWELPNMKCHVDEIVIGKFDPGNKKYQIAMASGEDGFLLVDQDGNMINRDMPGHAQRVSVADYRPDMPGLEICVVTFWRNTGIITMYDCKGNKLYSHEPGANGNIISPVRWNRGGDVYMLYTAGVRLGGLYDGYLEKVVGFPADGHPELCCDAVDLCGDGREELLAWDEKMMYIYTQADNPSELSFESIRYEEYNFSNYRGEFIFD